eukprot:TRINITY_DN1368_c0_g2_i1.p1 TRINITY_DN1368_c0_g2~~TRINITY_DN1368_c0_g2_i1.p1  ORF type:complete len:394 (+),score=64.77 TRINITY_DN1368_c0_g2_i1:173-1183(+)
MVTRPLSLLLVLLACVGCIHAQVTTYRNVSVWESELLDVFVATAANIKVDKQGQGTGSIIADATRLAMWGNKVQLVHFQGSAYAKNSDLTSATGAGFEFFLGYAAIVEYMETDAQLGYQLGDTIVSTYALDTLYNIDTSVENRTAADGTQVPVYNVTFTTLDGVFSYWTAYSGHDMATLGNTKLGANSIKMGFNIKYKYRPLDTSQSKLALVCVVASRSAAGRAFKNDGSGNAGVSVTYGAYKGFTNFETKADLWNTAGVHTEAAVKVDYHDDTNSALIGAGYKGALVVLSYDAIKPAYIYYDPSMGAEIPENAAAHVTATAATLMVIAVLSVLFM